MSSFENGGFFNYSSIIIGLNSTNIFMNFMTQYEMHFLVCNAVDMYNARFFLIVCFILPIRQYFSFGTPYFYSETPYFYSVLISVHSFHFPIHNTYAFLNLLFCMKMPKMCAKSVYSSSLFYISIFQPTLLALPVLPVQPAQTFSIPKHFPISLYQIEMLSMIFSTLYHEDFKRLYGDTIGIIPSFTKPKLHHSFPKRNTQMIYHEKCTVFYSICTQNKYMCYQSV